jgi:hypothetical protein
LLRDNRTADVTLTALWDQITHVPEWVDWNQIERGQDVFYRYGAAALTGLTYQALLGGMGAGRVVETLARTGGFSPKVARKRLYETTQHILQVTKDIEAIKPGGEGWVSTVRVRLLHAAVRGRITKLVQSRPDYYNVEKNGIPVNDLDSIGTTATFSATLIWLSFPRQGIFLRRREIEDYIALWRYVAWVIGTPTEWFETPESAKAIMECLLLYEIEPTETSKVLAYNVIDCLAGQPPSFTSAPMLIASARWLNGNELGDALGLPKSTLYYRMLMAGQCLVFMFLAYGYRYVKSWDRKKISFLRRIFWKVIVDSKDGLAGEQTMFEFKYVPSYGRSTASSRESVNEKLKRKYGYIERRNFTAFLVATSVCGVALATGLKVLTVMFSR